MALGFSPAPLAFSWHDRHNRSAAGLAFPTAPRSGTFQAASRLALPSQEGKERQPFLCRAQHGHGSASVQVTNPGSSPVPPPPAVLRIHPPSREEFQGPFRNSTLLCRLHGPRPRPGHAHIRWLRNGAPVGEGGAWAEGPAPEGSGSFVSGSRLVVTEAEWERGDVFTCRAGDEERNTSKAMECGYDQPLAASDLLVEPSGPTFAELFRERAARLRCRVSRLAAGAEGLSLTWLGPAGEALPTRHSPPALAPDGLLAAEAVATVSAEAWESGATFTCRVQHPELLFPREVTLRKEEVPDASPPSLYLLPPPPDQLRSRTWATLTCLVRDFNPPDLLLQWLQDGRPLPQGRAVTFRPRPDSGHAHPGHARAHLSVSALTVPYGDWEGGAVFTCLVGHERLPLRLAQKSVDRASALLGGAAPEEDEELRGLWATASTFIVLFILSLFYSATVTLIKVK